MLEVEARAAKDLQEPVVLAEASSALEMVATAVWLA
jgi:hypothetical protein